MYVLQQLRLVLYPFNGHTMASFEGPCNILSCGYMTTWLASVENHGCGAYHMMHVLKHRSKCLTYMRRVMCTWICTSLVRMCDYDKELSHTNAIPKLKLDELSTSNCVFIRTSIDRTH